METLKEIIKRNTIRYPNMEMEDAVKLVYQHTFGMDQEIDIGAEYEKALADPSDYLCEDIGGGYCRVHLNGIPVGNLTIEKLRYILVKSVASDQTGGLTPAESKTADNLQSPRSGCEPNPDEIPASCFEDNLKELYDVVREGYFNFDYKEFQKFLWDYEEKGYPALEHSRTFISQYEPHYVVVKQEILNAVKTSFSKVFLRIYDRKIQSGEVTFSQIGIPKPLFVVICNNQNYIPSDELLEKLKENLKLTEEETRELYESAGKTL